MQRCWYAFTLLFLSLLSGPLMAQFIGYEPFGETIRQDPIDNRALVDRALEDAPWQVGPVRLSPTIDVQNVAFSTGLAGERRDLAWKARAGVFGIIPLGLDSAVSGEISPGYVWYRNDSGRSTYHELFRAQFYGFFNRLQVHGEASRRDDLAAVTPEVGAYVSRHVEEVLADIDLRAYRSLHIFVEGGFQEDRGLDEDDDLFFSRLDRQETLVDAGVRLLRGASGSSFEIGLERSETDFDARLLNRSNEGTYPFVGGVLTANRNRIQARAAFRDLQPVRGSVFAGYDSLTGFVSLEHSFSTRTTLDLRYRRRIGYTIDDEGSHYRSTRLEAQYRMPVHRRIALRIFGELGPDDYFGVSDGQGYRKDDVVGLGTALELPLGDRAELTVGYSFLDYQSSLPSRSRTDRNVLFSFSLSAFGGEVAVQ